jgi:hypothetical protein
MRDILEYFRYLIAFPCSAKRKVHPCAQKRSERKHTHEEIRQLSLRIMTYERAAAFQEEI